MSRHGIACSRDTTNQGVRGRKSSVRVVSAALRVWPLATVGSRPPGNLPHQFSQFKSGVVLTNKYDTDHRQLQMARRGPARNVLP